jgi:hypothetical protein
MTGLQMMKQRYINIFTFLIIFLLLVTVMILSGCRSLYSNQAAYIPMEFDTIDKLKNEIALRSAASYDGEDPQDLANLHELYQFSNLPEDIRATGYIVSGSYVTASYLYLKDDEAFFTLFKDDNLSKEDMTAIAVTVFRTLGQNALDQYVAKNKSKGEIISMAGISGVFLVKGSYDGKAFSKNYDFIYLEKYFSLTVPENLPAETIESLVKSLVKIPLDVH